MSTEDSGCFPYFFQYCIRQETNFSHLIKLLLKEFDKMTAPTPVFCNQLLVLMNFYQHAKNQTFSSFYSRDIVDLKILQTDWQEHFN